MKPTNISAKDLKFYSTRIASELLLISELKASQSMRSTNETERINAIISVAATNFHLSSVRYDLMRILKKDPSQAARMAAARSIGIIGGQWALNILIDSLPGQKTEVQAAIVIALIKAGGKKDIPELRQTAASADYKSVRKLLVDAINGIKEKDFDGTTIENR